MVKKNVLGSDYVNVLESNISSWCASSSGTILHEEQTLNNAEVSDVPSRHPQTKNF
jgi:hypothetical protein